MSFPNEHLSYYLDTLGIVACYYPLLEEGRTDDRDFREVNQEMFCRSLRFGTFGPPSNEPSAYLMSTLGVAETGDTAQSINFAVSHPVYHGEQKHFFRAKETFYGPVIRCETLGYCWYPDDAPEAETKRSILGTFHVSLDNKEVRDRCLAFGRAALDRYLAFLYLHEERDAWGVGLSTGLNLGRFVGRSQMRERAAKVVEDEENGGEQLPEFPYLRRDIAERIRALEVWR